MPTYEYKCADCNKSFDVVLTIQEHETKKVRCPRCKSPHVRQEVSPFFAITSHKS